MDMTVGDYETDVVDPGRTLGRALSRGKERNPKAKEMPAAKGKSNQDIDFFLNMYNVAIHMDGDRCCA